VIADWHKKAREKGEEKPDRQMIHF